MGNKKKSHDHAPETLGKLGKKEYEDALKDLHVELVKLQQWVVAKGLKVIVIFEGRDGAGVSGTELQRLLKQTIKSRTPPNNGHLQLRPGTNDAQRDAGRAAVTGLQAGTRVSASGRQVATSRSLGQAGGTAAVLGRRLIAGFVASGANQLTGQWADAIRQHTTHAEATAKADQALQNAPGGRAVRATAPWARSGETKRTAAF